MSNVQFRGGSGAAVAVSADAVGSLASKLTGSLVEPGMPGYDEARTIWNGMIDRRPALIARCRTPDDVAAAVRFAAEHDLLLAVRGGGHNIAGNAVCEGGFMIDLSLMKRVEVDPGQRRATVEPGVTLGELDVAAQAHGLATPLGINSTTGVAGLTLGGGFGWLSRKHGLTIDNLEAADVVLATGARVRASATQNPDLFWAIRGGGGNFGVVTSFEYRLHPVGPEVFSGLIVHPLADARAVLRHYREFCATAPEELTCWVVLRQAPPLPFLPAASHFKEALIIACCYLGDAEAGARALEPLSRYGFPIAVALGPTPYAGWQTAFDPLLTPGARNYWKSHDFTALSDELIDAVLPAIERLPDFGCEAFFAQVGGATARVPATDSAYTHRDAAFVMNVHGRWTEPAKDEACIEWSRDLFEATTPYATGGVYVNFLTEEEGARVRLAYGVNYDRLVELKNRYDPSNLFRLNQNIRPTVLA